MTKLEIYLAMNLFMLNFSKVYSKRMLSDLKQLVTECFVISDSDVDFLRVISLRMCAYDEKTYKMIRAFVKYIIQLKKYC